MKLTTFSGDLMWTAQLGGGGVLSLDLQERHNGWANDCPSAHQDSSRIC